jgi:hypothetical protein
MSNTKTHTKACLANAMISAIQNGRDNRDFDDERFERFADSHSPFDWAIGYLDEGLQSCVCYPKRGSLQPDASSKEFFEEVDKLWSRRALLRWPRGTTSTGPVDTTTCGACNV